MGRARPIATLGLALAIVFVITNPTTASEQCRSGCGKSQDTLKFAVGTTYKYNYHGKVDVSLSSAEGQLITTEVKANVLLTQQAECQQVLQLQNVQIISGGVKKATVIEGLNLPVVINNKDGSVEDHICAEAADTQTSLNIKRAIASAFLVNLKDAHETDVFGLCPTQVSSSNEGGVLLVQKSRNLNKCAYRENIKQDFLATTFNKDSEIHSSPILSGDYIAKQKIKAGIVESVQIVENYLYMPFSVGKNGAKAQVVSKLELAGTSKAAVKATASKPKSIIFDNPHPVNVQKGTSSLANIQAAVQDVAKTIDVTVSDNTAKEFINLIKILRVSNKDDILSAYSKVKSGAGFSDKEGARKIFLDALLRAGTGDAIEVAVELLKNKEFNEWEQKKVYLGLSLVRHATLNSLNTASQLLSQPNLQRETYLGLGNLVGKYCRQHSCDKVDAVNKITDMLIKKLGDNKAANRAEETEMISVLKALGNFHHINEKIVKKIVDIAKDKTASTRLRVTALETFLSDPCKDVLRDTSLNILKDIQQDSEIRIKAYLAAVACPNAKIGNAIKTLLNTEPSYQVGGFIVSHIRNIKASANPDKDLQKQHLSFSTLPQRFPVDFRKWSYNGEFSYSWDTLGLAGASEANVIYSQDSWWPRSTSMNLTAEVFGHNVNFLEIETRQENLDRLIGHYFGPKGVLKSKSLHELWKNNQKPASDLLSQLGKKLEKSLRSRRDVSAAEIQKIAKEVSIKENTLDKDLDLDLSVRAFGSEMLFLNLNGNAQKWSPEQIIDKLIGEFAKGLDNLQNFEKTMRYNMIFLDAEFDYPTSTGFPLKIAVEGSANIQVKTKGAIDLRSIINKTKTNQLIKLGVIPSANIEVSGRITIDTFASEHGLKVVSTLHSALGGEANFEVSQNGQAMELKYTLPVAKQTLVSANHEVVSHSRDLGAKEVNTPLKFAQNKDFSICVDQLKDYIGLEFCGEYSGPNLSGKQVPVLPFPLAGDGNVKVEINREDVKEYVIRRVFNDEPNNLGGEIELSTIGNNGQKKTSVQLLAHLQPDMIVKAQLVSPKYNALAEAKVISNDQEKALFGRLNYLNNEFYGKLGVSVSGTPARQVYKPVLEYKTPDGGVNTLKSLEGQIIKETNGENVKYTFDNLKVAMPNAGKQLTLKGDLGKESGSLFTNLDISNGEQSAQLNGRVQVVNEMAKINVELKNSINPNANFKVQGEFKKGPKLESHLTIQHGPANSKTNILTVNNVFWKVGDESEPQKLEVGTKNRITYPALNMDLKLDFHRKPKHLESETSIQYQNFKAGSEFEIDIDGKEKGDYKLEWDLWGLDNKVELKSSRQIVGHECKIDNTLEVNDKKFEVKGTLRHMIKPQEADLAADLTVVLPTHNTPFIVASVLKYDPLSLDASQKISSGSNVIVDVFLKANKNGNANGSIKVNVKDQLVINGQLKSVKGAGNGDILIDLQGLKKQAKAETTFTVQAPKTYNVLVTLYPMFGQDKNKKIILSTQNAITETTCDSKNSVDLMGNKFVLNSKSDKTGDFKNGKISSEVEVILPNEQYFLGKLNRDMKIVNDVANGHSQLSLEQRKNKNTPGNKISMKATAKNTNLKEGVMDLEYNLAADNSNGKSINHDLVIKKQKNGEESKMDLRSKLYGSLIKNPVETTVSGNCHKGVGSINVKTTYGAEAKYTFDGKYDLVGEGKPYSGEFALTANTPSKILKTLKVSGSGSIKPASTPSENIEWQGAYSVFADDDGSKPEAILDLSSEASVKANPKDGHLKASIKYAKRDPITLSLGYSKNESEDKKQMNLNGALQYEQNKNVKVDVSLKKNANHEYTFVGQLDTPIESHKNNKIIVNTKRSPDTKTIESNVELVSDGKKWTAETKLMGGANSLIDIQMRCPEGKLTQFMNKHHQVTDRHFESELKIICERKDFLLESKMDAQIESVDDFQIKGSMNSPALKLENIVFEVMTKPGSNGKKIQVNVKSANKNLLSGVTSYQSKVEGHKTIVEGSGSFQVKEETKSGNFKFISQKLTKDKNQEDGIDISFDAKLGNKAIDAEFKATNKQFRILNSYCEEKKECAHIELDSKANINGAAHYNQELEINIDLRKLGLTHEFGLKSVTNRDGWVVDHTVDVHFQNKEKSKYQYSFYVHPKEAGWSLTTPKRIVAMETKADYPKNVLKAGGKVSMDVSFYLDKKNQPAKKTSLNSWVNINKAAMEGEIKFTHPGLQRPLSASLKSTAQGEKGNRQVSVTVELDIFAQPGQKIVIQQNAVSKSDLKSKATFKNTVSAKSTGLNININWSDEYSADKEQMVTDVSRKLDIQIGGTKLSNEVSAKLSKTQANVLVRFLNTDVLKVTSKINLSKDQQIVDTEVSSYDKNPIVSKLEIKNWNTMKYEAGFKNTPNKKLVLSSGLIPGQIADVRSDLITPGGKVNLFHASLKLDDANFLKPDYGVDSKKIHEVLTNVRGDVSKYVSGMKELQNKWVNTGKKVSNELSEIAKKAVPNMGPVKEYYASELKKLREEVMSDKTIKDLSEFFRSIFGTLTKVMTETFGKFSELVEQISKSIQASFSKVLESIEKELIPQLQKTGQKLLEVVGDILNNFVDVVLGVLVKINEIIEQYQPEIKQLATALSGITQDLGKFVLKAYQNAKTMIVEQWKKIYSEIKALPVFEELKNQYEELVKNGMPNSEFFLNIMKEFLNSVYEILPANMTDLKQLLVNIEAYIEKKLKNQAVDDMAELEKIFKSLLVLIKKFADIITMESKEIKFINPDLSLNLGLLTKLPRIAAIKFSPLSHILKEESNAYVDFLLSLYTSPRLASMPFPLVALIGQGQHVFTFDGRQINFPANCNYLLARDALNGKFNLVGSYSNGALNALTLSDGKDTITIKKGGQVTMNNAPTELPARKATIGAYRDYHVVKMVTSTGVTVGCTPDLQACIVSLSGYYHGEIRGVLGNGNNDPYDDFTLPNGKIVQTENEFGNAYKVGNCPAVVVKETFAGPDAPACSKLFAWDSSLALCYKFVKVDNFKKACNVGVAAGNKDTVAAIAGLYVHSCITRNIPAAIPEYLLKCENGDKLHEVGEKFSVKLPSKSADFVILLDTTKPNEKIYKELVQPLVLEILKELHDKQMNDVEFHLITYGGENLWPSHVTVNGKLQFKGKPPGVKFADGPKHSDVHTENEKVDKAILVVEDLLRSLKLALGLDLQAQTYTEALKYPFRFNAVKSIIAVTSRPCETGKLLLLQKLRTLFFRNNQIHLNLITPFDSLTVKDAKKSKDVVGFNKHNVFTMSQGKKKPEGSSELHKDLEYNDFCVDFTIKNNGNVFVTNNFLAAKGDAKTFVSVAAHNIVDNTVDVESGLDCECKRNSPFGAQNVCWEIYSKDKSKKTGGKS
ncbi:unnamed protein product [Brassicogethes aeneus]|uniref:Apolipophorin n=1 Tax=Brassicogethes aeneus TaxID=1431903 RepID=A0A9P0ASV5_BRAAE|nr:unnamed protein product [Brassicogethes aeneus]